MTRDEALALLSGFLGLPLNEHIQNVMTAMQGTANELGLVPPPAPSA